MKRLPITELTNADGLYGRAVVILATEEGSLRERLASAHHEAHLVHAVPCPPDRTPVPDDIAEAIWELNETMNQRPAAGDEGTTAATVQLMTDDGVRLAAQILIDIADRLSVASALANR